LIQKVILKFVLSPLLFSLPRSGVLNAFKFRYSFDFLCYVTLKWNLYEWGYSLKINNKWRWHYFRFKCAVSESFTVSVLFFQFSAFFTLFIPLGWAIVDWLSGFLILLIIFCTEVRLKCALWIQFLLFHLLRLLQLFLSIPDLSIHII